MSETNCRIGDDGSDQRRNSTEEDPLNSLCLRPRYCDPHRNPMERVLLEIVDTEAIYVEHLRQVIQVSVISHHLSNLVIQAMRFISLFLPGLPYILEERSGVVCGSNAAE